MITKAYWRGFEIIDLDIHEGWCDIIFKMSDYQSPLTGTGRFRARWDEIEVKAVEA